MGYIPHLVTILGNITHSQNFPIKFATTHQYHAIFTIPYYNYTSIPCNIYHTILQLHINTMQYLPYHTTTTHKYHAIFTIPYYNYAIFTIPYYNYTSIPCNI